MSEACFSLKPALSGFFCALRLVWSIVWIFCGADSVGLSRREGGGRRSECFLLAFWTNGWVRPFCPASSCLGKHLGIAALGSLDAARSTTEYFFALRCEGGQGNGAPASP
jgi:hypothetical protein